MTARTFLGRRTTLEIVVLWFALVAGVGVMLIGGVLAFVYVRNPDADLRGATSTFVALLASIVGALMGLLAGRSARVAVTLDRDPDPD